MPSAKQVTASAHCMHGSFHALAIDCSTILVIVEECSDFPLAINMNYNMKFSTQLS